MEKNGTSENDRSACITIAENYQDMMSIISENPNFSDYAKILGKKYDFDRNQVVLVKMMTVDDLFSADKYRENVEKCEADIERYQNWINDSKGEV